MKGILVPTDGSEFARKAYEYALELAQAAKSEVIALYVVETKSKEEMAKGREILDELVKMGSAKKVKVKPILREGTPFKEVIKVADRLKVGQIVLGVRSVATLTFFPGSTSQNVIKLARQPVTLIK